MKTLRILLVLLASLFALAAWAKQDDAQIKAGDRVRIMVQEEPAMNRDYTVSGEGLVMVDFLGAVKIGGLTEREASKKVSEKLVTDRIMRKATVTLTLLRVQLKMVKFSGEVGLEAEAPFREGITLADIVRLAEPKGTADLSNILILSEDGGQARIDATKMNAQTGVNNPKLKAGDHVIFPKRVTATQPNGTNPGTGTTVPTNPPRDPQPQTTNKVSVEGAVVLPGQYDFVDGMLARDIVIRAGGFATNAETSQITLVRPNEANRTLRLPSDGFTPIRPGDKVIVGVRLIRVLIRVEGAVQLPGEIEMVEGMKLSGAIQRAGGLRNDARAEQIRIIGPNGEKPRIVNLRDIEAGYTGDVELRPGTRIEVPGRGGRNDDRLVRTAGAAAILILLLGR